MATNPTTPKNSNVSQTGGGLPAIAYVFIALGGGVVGRDYAVGANIDPTTGLVMGLIISAVLTGILNLIRQNEDGISKALSWIGFIGGLVLGSNIFFNDPYAPDGAWMIIPIFGVIGGIVGQVVAACIVFLAFAALALSQGPLGFFLRETLLHILNG